MNKVPGLTKPQLQEIQNILQNQFKSLSHQIHVFVFGSLAEGGFRPSSDLDLYFTGTKEFLPRVWAHLEEAFENSSLPFKVDLIDEHQLSPAIKSNIASLKKILIFPVCSE